MNAAPHEIRFEARNDDAEKETAAAVTVTITLFNYEDYILEALDSVRDQELETFDLVVVDDASRDRSLETAERWMRAHAPRFRRVTLARHLENSGLPVTRSTAFALARTDFGFVLDADNQLYPRCLSRCLEAIESSDAAFVFPTLEVFGARTGLLGALGWDVELLERGNYIDAMSLIRLSACRDVGGYSRMKVSGWEDYDLWCKFAEKGYFGLRVPEVLARYRVHEASMLHTSTNPRMDEVRDEMQRVHPWLKLDAVP